MADEQQFPQPEPVSPNDVTVPDQPAYVSPTDVTVPNLPALPIVPPPFPPSQSFVRRQTTLFSGRTILLIILAIALISGGLGFIVFAATEQYRSSIKAQSTAQARLTVRARATTQAYEQETANIYATANGNIYASATAQAAVTATATALSGTATARATAQSSLLDQATSGTAVLNDPLSDNSGNHGWDETNGTKVGACIFSASSYHALESQRGFFQPCIAETTNFSNFAYRVEMSINSGSQDGIIFRANTVTGSFYLFRVDTDGKYALDLYHNNKLAVTLSQGYTTAINTSLKHTNELAVIAYKSTIYLYDNKTFIASVTDNSLSSGKIGVFAIDYFAPSEAAFTNAKVWNVTATTFSVTPTPSASPTATTTATASPTGSATPTASPSATSTSGP